MNTITSQAPLGLHNIHSSGQTVRPICQAGEFSSKFAARFWQKVDQRGPDECWPWTGASLAKSGRGQVRVPSTDGSKPRRTAPSVAWQLATGKSIPPGQIVRHSCDNPPCCNPRHLLPGTQAQNIHDCIQRGRRNAFGRQKLHEADVLTIRARATAGDRPVDIAADYGIGRNTVSGIVNGHSWKHLLSVPVRSCQHTVKNAEVGGSEQAGR